MIMDQQNRKRKRSYLDDQDDQPPRKKRFNPTQFASEWLSNPLNSGDVQTLEINLDTMTYADILDNLLKSVDLDRDFGFSRLMFTGDSMEKPVGVTFKKRTLYEVSLDDADNVYEIGLGLYSPRHFKKAKFTEFGETYSEMCGRLDNLEISRDAFYGAVKRIDINRGKPKEWRLSAAIFAYMLSEAGRFIPVNRVLRIIMCLDLRIILNGNYLWMSKIVHKWGLFSQWARELKKTKKRKRKAKGKDEAQTNIFLNEWFRDITKGYKKLLKQNYKQREAACLTPVEEKEICSESLINETWDRDQLKSPEFKQLCEWRKMMEDTNSGVKFWEVDKKIKVKETARNRDTMEENRARNETIRFLLKHESTGQALLYLRMDGKIMEHSCCLFKDPIIPDAREFDNKIIHCKWNLAGKYWAFVELAAKSILSPSRYSSYKTYVDAKRK